jgi:2-dehydropantoate 2-reductase
VLGVELGLDGLDGVIHHAEGDRFPIGELVRQGDGAREAGARRAGLGRPQVADSRRHPRGDLAQGLGNLSFNPISALSHATLVENCQFPETRALAADMMREAEAVANKLGIKFRHTIEKRIEGAEAVGAHKTSMLQDVELGRSPRDRSAGRLDPRAREADRHARPLDPGGLRLRQAAQQGDADRRRRRAPEQGGVAGRRSGAGTRLTELRRDLPANPGDRPRAQEIPLTVARDGSLQRITIHSADRKDFLKKPRLQ